MRASTEEVPAWEPAEDRSLAERLHDGLSQQLFAAQLDLHELRGHPDLPEGVRALVERLSARLSAGARELREALLGAPPGAETDAPLPEALAELVAAVAADCPSLDVLVRVIGDGPAPPAAARRVLLRAAREGLANVIKHAGAAHALVALRRGPRWWTLEVHDDGSGESAVLRASMAQRRSFGLASLLANAAPVGGRLAVLPSAELGGILLTMTVPVRR
jgi:signal transduction histidine kinase